MLPDFERLEEYAVTSGNDVEFPLTDSVDVINKMERFTEHRVVAAGAGAAAATVEVRIGTEWLTITLDSGDWSTPQTIQAAGVNKIKVTAVTGDITADIMSYTP